MRVNTRYISSGWNFGILRMYLWWSSCTVDLYTYQMRVTVGDSGLSCTCVTYFKCELTPLCVDSQYRVTAIWHGGEACSSEDLLTFQQDADGFSWYISCQYVPHGRFWWCESFSVRSPLQINPRLYVYRCFVGELWKWTMLLVPRVMDGGSALWKY